MGWCPAGIPGVPYQYDVSGNQLSLMLNFGGWLEVDTFTRQ
jgi:hypothetical protein